MDTQQQEHPLISEEELKFAFSQDTPDCRGDLNTDIVPEPKEEPKKRQGLNAFVFTL